MRRAPAVSEAQARVLRLARDAGVVRYEDVGHTPTLRSCLRNRWLAPRENGHVITDGGLAALAHFHADELMEKLWKGQGQG